MSDQRRDNIEIRLHKDGTLDEIVVYDPHTGQGLFHCEQLSDNCFWMRAYGTTQDLVVHIGAIIGPCDGPFILGKDNEVLGYEKVEGPKVTTSFDWDDSVMEGDCDKKFHTPEVERRTQVAELINRYGVACVLQEITNIYSQGRMADHEQKLVENLKNTREKFLVGDKVYWDDHIKEMYKEGEDV